MSAISTAQSEVGNRMNLAELSKTMEFRLLSPKMARFVETYLQGFIETGALDPLAATQSSYDCRTEESARVFGYQLLANSKIVAVLDQFFGIDPEKAFIRTLKRAMHNPKIPVAQVDAMRLYMRLTGITAPGGLEGLEQPGAKTEPPMIDGGRTTGTHRFGIGDICVQDSKNYRVVRVDATGKILEAEEIA